jgi:N-acetylglucosamine kinase-like BadF-type ATPase
MEKFIIGIDGGGTKTDAIIANLNGEIVAEDTGGSANFQMLGVEPVAQTLIDIIHNLIDRAHADIKNVQMVVIGLTGAGRRGDRDRIYKGILSYARRRNLVLPEILIETDARIALEGALSGKPGMVLIAGTGSIMLAKDIDGKFHRVGGWGRFIGDEGSAYGIGVEALRAVAKHMDGRGEETLITRLIAEKFKLSDMSEIITQIYRGRFDIAKVAPLVMKAAETGDKIAVEILEKACYELILHIKAMLKRGRFGEKILLAFVGGVIENENYVSIQLKKRIQENFPQIIVKKPDFPPAYGAIVLGINKIKNKHKTDQK